MNPVDFGFDRSIMVNLTPNEIKNMMMDFAERFHQAKLNGVDYTIEELASAYYNVTTGMLHQNDPTRFVSNN